MVDAVKDAAAPAQEKVKKVKPTNCAQSNKRIRRKDWYYRDGKYFANKQCFKLYEVQEKEKKQKEADAKKAAAEAAKAAEATKATEAASEPKA